MNKISTLLKNKNVLGGLAIIGFSIIVSQCISPMNWGPSRYIAAHTVHIMLSFFFIGGVFFIRQRPMLMLYSWLACVALCQFLKDGQNNPFYYSVAKQEHPKLRFAYFEINNSDEEAILTGKLQSLNTQLISLHYKGTEASSHSLVEKLQHLYPYSYQMGFMHEDGLTSLFVYSQFRLEEMDTFHSDGLPYFHCSLSLDSAQQNIRLLSLFLPESISNDPTALQQRLESISAKWEVKELTKIPMLVFGAVPSSAWSPELRGVRSRFALNDSRLDLDLKADKEHIFYSNHIGCLSFERMQDGMGVIGEYQLNTSHLDSVKISAITQR